MTQVQPLLDRFYPIVPDSIWLQRLAPLGIKTVQLRAKALDAQSLRREIETSIAIARHYGCQLIINDYWQLAIDAGAHFIHLGQEDLAAADLKAIKRAGMRLGVSTHDDVELEVALAAKPDYIALGPVYETKLKAMTWSPQGLERVATWKAKIGTIPLVAIGGITPERAPGVIKAGADSVAVITDFMTHSHPEVRAAEWVAWAAGSASP